MTSKVNADNTLGGVILSGDSSGILELQAGGVTKVTVGPSGMTLVDVLPVASGGTGTTTTPPAGAIPYGTGTAQAYTAVGASGQYLTSAGAGTPTWTALSVSSVTGTLPVANGGTGATSLTTNNVILGNGTSAVQVVAPSTAGNVLTSDGTTWQSTAPAAGFSTSADNTFTGTQTFAGTSAKLAVVLSDAAEVATVSATAATGTINYDITTQSVLYYTSNASANWTVNFRASTGTSLNTALAVGQSVTAAFLVTNGGTAYYNSAVQVDGSSVTPKWQGGTAPSAGNASSIDVYTYTIIKTASATFTILASQTKFA